MPLNVKYVSPHDGRFQFGVIQAQRRAWQPHRHLTMWLFQRYTLVREAILINITEHDEQNFDSPIEQPHGWCQFVCQYRKTVLLIVSVLNYIIVVWSVERTKNIWSWDELALSKVTLLCNKSFGFDFRYWFDKMMYWRKLSL